MIPWEQVELRAGDVLQAPLVLTWNVPRLVVGLNIVRAQRRFFWIFSLLLDNALDVLSRQRHGY